MVLPAIAASSMEEDNVLVPFSSLLVLQSNQFSMGLCARARWLRLTKTLQRPQPGDVM